LTGVKFFDKLSSSELRRWASSWEHGGSNLTVDATSRYTHARTEHVVVVWDPVVRLLYWSLVVAVAAVFVADDGGSGLHRYAGILVLVLAALRVVWGFVGPSHARFSDFVKPAPEVLAYALDLFRGRARRYNGHSPLTGAMVVALLVVLFLTGVTGALATTATGIAEGAAAIHAVSANLLLIMVFVQALLGLVVGVVQQDQPLRAMITGRKRG
jgi:cytochrome b